MILLDSDHITQLHYRTHQASQVLRQRLDAADDPDVAVTVVTLEEQMTGWLAFLRRARKPRQQIPAYERLASLFTLGPTI